MQIKLTRVGLGCSHKGPVAMAPEKEEEEESKSFYPDSDNKDVIELLRREQHPLQRQHELEKHRPALKKRKGRLQVWEKGLRVLQEEKELEEEQQREREVELKQVKKLVDESENTEKRIQHQLGQEIEELKRLNKVVDKSSVVKERSQQHYKRQFKLKQR